MNVIFLCVCVSVCVNLAAYCLHVCSSAWIWDVPTSRVDARSSVCFCVWLRLVRNLLSHAHVCVFFLFLTPMSVLLQDSVPMASPAFLLSLFVSIQVLPQISPEPGCAPYALIPTHTHNVTHSTHICLHLSSRSLNVVLILAAECLLCILVTVLKNKRDVQHKETITR